MKSLNNPASSTAIFCAAFWLGGVAHAQTTPNLLQNGDFSGGKEFWSLTSPPRVQAEFVDVADRPFRRAIRLTITPQQGDKPWAAALRQKLTAGLQNGDKLTLKLWARSPQSLPLVTSLEAASAPYGSFSHEKLALSPDWREYEVSAVPKQDFAPGEAQLTFQLALGTGIFEIAGIRLESPTTQGAPTLATPVTAVTPLIANGDFAAALQGNWKAKGRTRPSIEVVKLNGQPNPFWKGKLTQN